MRTRRASELPPLGFRPEQRQFRFAFVVREKYFQFCTSLVFPFCVRPKWKREKPDPCR
jgi:hypothetical protein